MNKKKTWNGSVALVVGHVVSQLGGFLHSCLKAIAQQRVLTHSTPTLQQSNKIFHDLQYLMVTCLSAHCYIVVLLMKIYHPIIS